MLNWFYTWMGLSNASGPIYLWWSGFFAALGTFTLVGSAYMLVRHHNCHVVGCRKFIRTAVDPKHGWYACKEHHSLGHLAGISHHA